MIDGRLPAEWPADVLESVRLWRQGFVVEAPPFFYQRSESHPIWRMDLEADGEALSEELVDLEPSERSAYGLVTTQTCDLVEEGRPKQPWFAVAPVYDITDRLTAGQLPQLQKGYLNHLVLLTATWLPPGQWVADMRIEMPIEKGWLVGREPRAGFAELSEFERLAGRLASRRGRPALSTALTAELTGPLRKWLTAGPGKASRDSVESMRLRVVGDPAMSAQAELIVIHNDEGLSSAATAAWVEWESARSEAAHLAGVTLLPFRFGTLDDFSARDVATSFRLELDHLSPD